MNNVFGKDLQGDWFEKPLWSLLPCHQTIETEEQGFSFTSIIELRSIVGLFNNEMNKRGFIFEGMPRWSLINLVTLIHGYSYLISLEIVAVYRKLGSFQGTQLRLSMLLEKEIS